MAKESGMAWTTCSVDDSGDDLRALVNDVTAGGAKRNQFLIDVFDIGGAVHHATGIGAVDKSVGMP